MKTKMKLAWFCLLAAGLTVAQNAVAQEEASKPNVVLMLSDNVGYGDIGAFQGGAIRGAPTPKIDSIAAEGMTLTQFLVEPGCTPSRAGLFPQSFRKSLPFTVINV